MCPYRVRVLFVWISRVEIWVGPRDNDDPTITNVRGPNGRPGIW
jgi:hypothetical protein